jgi:hypothetical protein
MLEFDHVHEFARGGESTADNVRLLCRVAPGVATRGSH